MHAHRSNEVRLQSPETPPKGKSSSVAVDIGSGYGALVVHSDSQRAYLEVEICPLGHPESKTHVYILPREAGERTIYAGLFPSLPVGPYIIFSLDGSETETVYIEDEAIAEQIWT